MKTVFAAGKISEAIHKGHRVKTTWWLTENLRNWRVEIWTPPTQEEESP